MKATIRYCIFALGFLLIPQAGVAWVTKAEREQVKRYCEDYSYAVAEIMLEDPDLAFQTKLGKENLFLRAFNGVIQGLFQPRDARFAASYICRFSDEEKAVRARVNLLLTRFQDYAEYTQWKKINLIGLGRVKDSSSQVAYYIVPKYLRINGE